LIGGQKLVIKAVDRNEDFIQNLIESEKRFWDYVVSGNMPEIDGSDSSVEILNDYYPLSKPESILLPQEADDLILTYRANKEIEETAKLAKQEVENKLKIMLGENEAGFINEYIVKWKSAKAREIFDGKRFKEEKPDVYSQYLKQGEPSRRFSINKIKEETSNG
jgi:predicted phage-related endonuclease